MVVEVVGQVDALVDVHGVGGDSVGGHVLAAVVEDVHLPAVLHQSEPPLESEGEVAGQFFFHAVEEFEGRTDGCVAVGAFDDAGGCALVPVALAYDVGLGEEGDGCAGAEAETHVAVPEYEVLC